MRYKSTILAALSFGLLFTLNSVALATGVDQMWLNLEGYAGKTIQTEIILEGTDPEERSGFWYAHYKEKEGDSEKMDITSWITIEPKDYTIKEKEIKTFSVIVKIPKNSKPGLYGAISEDAWKEGYSGERRTYIVFKDALGQGNVYSGLLIPVLVEVLPNPNPLARMIDFAQQNILAIVLSLVIILLLAVIFFNKRKTGRQNNKTKTSYAFKPGKKDRVPPKT